MMAKLRYKINGYWHTLDVQVEGQIEAVDFLNDEITFEQKGNCMWCGKTYEEHRDKPFPGGAVAKTPCMIMKSGYRERS